MPKDRGFTAIVRAAMAEHLPRYKFERTEKGSGPVVFFRVPTLAPRIAQQVFIQKGMYGATWLRANFTHAFVDKKKQSHELGQNCLPDLRYTTDEELAAGFVRILPALEKALGAQARAAKKLVPKLAKLLDGLATHAKKWMVEGGNALSAKAFDEDSFARPAFNAFKAWLVRRKLYVKAADLAVWHWWTDHHPKPKRSAK